MVVVVVVVVVVVCYVAGNEYFRPRETCSGCQIKKLEVNYRIN